MKVLALNSPMYNVQGDPMIMNGVSEEKVVQLTLLRAVVLAIGEPAQDTQPSDLMLRRYDLATKLLRAERTSDEEDELASAEADLIRDAMLNSRQFGVYGVGQVIDILEGRPNRMAPAETTTTDLYNALRKIT